MIQYQISIDKFPAEITGPSSLTGFIEGDFAVLVNGVEVFKEPEFLIYEFFDALHNWVNSDGSEGSDFYFASMDYEEEPVISFRYDNDTKSYVFESVFQISPAKFSFKDILHSHRQFMVDLRELLSRDYGYFLEL